MCYYIIGILPKNVDIDSLNTIKGKYNMRFEPHKTMMVDKYIPKKSITVRCTESDCDCGTSLLHGETRENNEEELIMWFFMIKDLLALKKMKYMGLLIQWFDQHKPTNLLKNKIKLDINKITYLDMCKLEEDVLYIFK